MEVGSDARGAQLMSIEISLVQKRAPTQSMPKLQRAAASTDKRTDTPEAEPVLTRRFLQNSPDSLGVRQV